MAILLIKNKEMENIVLKQSTVDKIKGDPILYGQVAQALDLKPISLINVLATNHQKLTQAGVMRVLREYLGEQDSELLETTLQEA
jgi:hypothetical protein